jgi:hypothetical protein
MARYEQDDVANELDHSNGGGNIAPGSQSGYARGIRTLLISMVAIVSLLIFTFNYNHGSFVP